jgi:hypothetical protein
MHIWRDIWPELSVAFYLFTWIVVLLMAHVLSR